MLAIVPGGESGQLDWITSNILENRLTAVLLLAFATYLALFALGGLSDMAHQLVLMTWPRSCRTLLRYPDLWFGPPGS